MSEPIYFVVENRNGKEIPSICHGMIIPRSLTRKITPEEKSPLVYSVRIDKLPDAEWWLSQPISILYMYYKGLRKQNKLPVMT